MNLEIDDYEELERELTAIKASVRGHDGGDFPVEVNYSVIQRALWIVEECLSVQPPKHHLRQKTRKVLEYGVQIVTTDEDPAKVTDRIRRQLELLFGDNLLASRYMVIEESVK